MTIIKIHFLIYLLLSVIILLGWVWGSLALFYAGPAPTWLRYGLVMLFIVTLPFAFYFGKTFWQAVLFLSVIFILLLLWWFTLKPVNDKNWQPEVAQIPYGEINGDILTLHNVRNFHYRSVQDFDQHWETRTYNLANLTSLDLILSYWGSRHIAHTILSWGFANGDHLAISIETRKDVTQSYSSIKGFFKQYTLVYVAADESDLIRLRTNIRKEEVYLYPLIKVPAERARTLLESYVQHMNRLVEQPEFYHALQMNCTSVITLHTKTIDPKGFIADWRMIVNGYIDEMLYERRSIRNDLPFARIRELSRVDLRMQQSDNGNFSARLRTNAPIQ